MTIARVNFYGRITPSMAQGYADIFQYIKRKRRITAVVLVVNSGGGDATASEMLYRSLAALNAIKPVYAVIQGIGASGAYWVAIGARKIYAMSTSIVGSIGVISVSPNIRKMLEKIGVEINLFKAGKHKDMLSPFGEQDEEARSLYQNMLNDVYEVFRSEVVKRRGLDASPDSEATSGLVFSSKKALDLKLIDKIGGLEEAIEDVARDFNLPRKVKTFEPKRPLVSRLIGMASETILSELGLN
ncbi:MAG: signal peptide peptidase SppA [Thermoplasmataceae archaeon]